MTLLDLGLVSRLLGRGLARGGDLSEVYVQKRRTIGLVLQDGDIKSVTCSDEYGVGLRVIKGHSVAYAHSDDLSEHALLSCADAAAYVAGQLHGEVHVVAKPMAQRVRAHHADALQRPDDDIAARRALLLRAHVAAKGASTSVLRVLGSYVDVDEDILIANSEGLLVTDARVLCRMSIEVIAADSAGERKSGSGGGGSRAGISHFDSVQTPEQIGAEAVRMAVAQFDARPAPLGEHVVVVGPSSSGVLLHEAVGHGLEADFIRKKTSLFAGRLGEQVASALCTVVDDGTVVGKRGSLNVDDEGEPTKRNVLIERGVLRGYLNDAVNADALAMDKSGNARRQSFRHPPLPRMTNTFLASGMDDPDDITRSVARGVYCKSFGGGQVDISSGSFVFEVREGYLIEDGKLTAPIKGATLVGSGPEVLKRISRVGHDGALDAGSYTCGKDGQSVPVCVGLPTVRIDGITIGAHA